MLDYILFLPKDEFEFTPQHKIRTPILEETASGQQLNLFRFETQ